jgi:Mg/Co/Ni transporter MgtE
MRVSGGVTVASLLAAAVVFVVGGPFVGRVGGDPAFAGNSLVQTVQDLTVVCHGPGTAREEWFPP